MSPVTLACALMKTGGKTVAGRPAHASTRIPTPRYIPLLTFCFLMSGCETLDFFLRPSADAATNEVSTSARDHTYSKSDFTVAAVDEKTGQSLEPVQQSQPTPDDLWVRLRSGLSFHKNHNREVVTRARTWFEGKQSYIERVAGRANLYLHYILTRIEQRGLPSELALIPVIESGYQPFARSPSGAAGLWQFIPSTGKRFGLKQNWWYDGRRDVVAATEAALDYLEYLNTEFDGDWLLAIAAYNAGEGTVRAAVKKNRKANRETHYWSLNLPRETERYIPRLLALAQVVENPGAVGLELPPLSNRAYFSIVALEHQIDLALVSELAGISMDEVYYLNPGFNRWATDPDGPHRVLIPWRNHRRFTTGLEGTSPENLVTWRRHEVLSGETLSEIAAKHHTTVATLQQVNNLTDTLIRAGRSLIVPTSARPLSEYTLSAASRGVIEQPASGEKITYVVRKGDNLWSIARRHDTRVKKIAAWNGISASGVLRPGQKLVIWHETTSKQPSQLIEVSATPASQGRYTVRRGDSLWTISRRFGVTVTALRRWNGISEQKYLQPGQQLKVNPSNDAI